MIDPDEAAIIKGMLARGDKQQWIVAWFGGRFNPGRIAEIGTGLRFAEVAVAPLDHLPPVGPYITATSAQRALVAIGPVKAAIDRAMKRLTILAGEETGAAR
jgi:hypothetical protein